MLTLKRHYAVSVTLQLTGIAVIVLAKKADGTPFSLTETGKKGVNQIGFSLLLAGGLSHYAAHGRTIGRAVKGLKRMVKK